MTEGYSRKVFSTRTRSLSSDVNRALRLDNRNLSEGLAAIAGGQSGVLYGFEVAITGTGTNISVAAGLALLRGSDTYPDSQWGWCEIRLS